MEYIDGTLNKYMNKLNGIRVLLNNATRKVTNVNTMNGVNLRKTNSAKETVNGKYICY